MTSRICIAGLSLSRNWREQIVMTRVLWCLALCLLTEFSLLSLVSASTNTCYELFNFAPSEAKEISPRDIFLSESETGYYTESRNGITFYPDIGDPIRIPYQFKGAIIGDESLSSSSHKQILVALLGMERYLKALQSSNPDAELLRS